MEIHTTASGAAVSSTLVDESNFSAFRILLDAGSADRDRVARTLSKLGRVDGEHVWVGWEQLVGLAGAHGHDPDWLAAAAAMRESVRRFGWVDENGGLRAHVVNL